MQVDRHIGWLGTGRMGTAMAERLISGGHSLVVWNRTASKTAPLVELGATCADAIGELSRCDIVFTSVTSSPDLLSVTLGPEGVVSAMTPPGIVVDTSTVSADTSAEVRSEAARRGIAFISAPISGNPRMVAQGRGSIIASGPAGTFETVRPLLEAIAPSVTFGGEGEEARLVKLAHNLLLGVITEALSEATTLVEKGGVRPSAFLEFIDGSVLGSSFIESKGQLIRTRNYEPTFTTENLRKDFDLGLAAARALEVPMPAAATTYHLIQTAVGHGYGQIDYAALYEVAARAAGLDDDR